MTLTDDRRSIISIFILIACLALPACQRSSAEAPAQGLQALPEPTGRPARPDLRPFIPVYDSLLQSRLDSSRCPGAAVVVVQDSEVVFLKAYGLKSTADTASHVDAHTLFRLGSLSKGFAGVIAAMLVQQGLLRLDERVVDILPRFALSDSAQTRRIRVWHLLAHCTGLPRHTYTSRVEGAEHRDSILAALRTVPLAGREGELFAYQNFSFSLVEDIVRQRTGKPYARVLEDYLLRPAGMADATLRADAWGASRNRALPHYNDPQGRYFPKPLNQKYFNTPSAGGLCASISDMGQWLRVLLGQRPDIVPAAVLDTAFFPRVETQSRAFAHRWEGSLGSHYGLGWRIIDFGDRQVVCHGGTVNQYRSEIALDREAGIGVCFLYNATAAHQTTAPVDFFQLYWSFLQGLGLGC